MSKRRSRFCEGRFTRVALALAFGFVLLGTVEVISRLAVVDPYPEVEVESETERDDEVLARHMVILGELDQAPLHPKAFNIFVYGASTVIAHPIGAQFSFSMQAREMLNDLFPGRTIHLRQYAHPGLSSWHVRKAVSETVHLDPDLIIICSGHNDLNESNLALLEAWNSRTSLPGRLRRVTLRYSHLGKWLLRGIHAVHPPTVRRAKAAGFVLPDDPRRQSALAAYRRNIEDCLDFARKRSIPVVLMTLPVNLKAWAPVMGEREMSMVSVKRLDMIYGRFKDALEAGEIEAAERGIAEMSELAAGHPLIAFAEGRLALEQGDSTLALDRFLTALERDHYPIRALPAVNPFLREAAERIGVHLLDAAALIDRASERGIAGYEFIVDHVHPSPEGHLLIARELVETMRLMGFETLSGEWDMTRLQGDVDYLERKRWTPAAQARAWMEVSELHWISKHFDHAVDVMIRGVRLDPNRQSLRFRQMTERYAYLMTRAQLGRIHAVADELGITIEGSVRITEELAQDPS